MKVGLFLIKARTPADIGNDLLPAARLTKT
jgi:hypothetical protein